MRKTTTIIFVFIFAEIIGLIFLPMLVFSDEITDQVVRKSWNKIGYKFGYEVAIKNREVGSLDDSQIVWDQLDFQKSFVFSNMNTQEKEKTLKYFKEGWFTGYEKGLYALSDEKFPYLIVNKKDISMKALTKALSQYTTSELANLPLNKRIKYEILVKPDLAKEEYIQTFNKVISDITTHDKEIDEISLWLYDDKDALSNSLYNVARVLWCPDGQWGFTVTPQIAVSNDRKGYRIAIDWSPEYEYKFSGKLQSSQRIPGEQITHGSESHNYEFNIVYPDVVKANQINKIEINILNKTNRDDESLTIECRDITKGDGVNRLLQDWDKWTFKIVEAEPKPKTIKSILGATYFDYAGLKAMETRRIALYFKATKIGHYLQKMMFYTDKHKDEEYELVSISRIICKK